MRALLAGKPATLAEVVFSLENAAGTVPGTVGRVDNAFDALDILDGTDATILFLEVSGPDDPQLFQINSLRAKGARVIVLAKEVSAELRVGAIKSGARDVLFAPWTPERVRSRLAGVGTSTGNVSIGTQVDLRAILLPEGSKGEIPARVKNLSATGLMAETGPTRIGRDAVIRIAIQLPAPHRLPVLFARCMLDSSGGNTTLRFVGLTADEETLLQRVISGTMAESEPAPVAAPASDFDDGATRVAPMPDVANPAAARAAIGRVIADLDASVLREAPSRWLGLTLPALTDAERLSLVDQGPLSEVAVWRTRAHVIANILEASPHLATVDLPFANWREGLSLARARIRTEVSLRMTEGDPARLRDTRDVQARLNAVSDRIDRIARDAGIDVGSDAGPLETPGGPAVFERPPPPPVADSGRERAREAHAPSRRGIARTLALGVFLGALVATAFGVHTTSASRRTRDIGREGVAVRPFAEIAGVRIRSAFPEPQRHVVVVDRSWYDRQYDLHPGEAEAAAREIATKLQLKGRVDFRDYAGKRLGQIDVTPGAVPLTSDSAGRPAPAATADASVTPAPAPDSPPPPAPIPRGKTPGRGPASTSR